MTGLQIRISLRTVICTINCFIIACILGFPSAAARAQSALSALPQGSVSTAIAPQLPAGPAMENDYFPVKLNSVWNFEASVSGRNVPLTAQVVRVKPNHDGLSVTMAWSVNGSRTQTERYRVMPGGVDRIAAGRDADSKYIPPFPIVRYPLTGGRHWTWKGIMRTTGQDVPAAASVTASGPTWIQTPAGRFAAMRIHCDLTFNVDGQQISQPTDFWLAPGVGFVQQQMQLGSDSIEGRLANYRQDMSRVRNTAPGMALPGRAGADVATRTQNDRSSDKSNDQSNRGASSQATRQIPAQSLRWH